MILSWRIHQVASTKQFWKAFLGYGDWWDLYILRKMCCGQWGAVGVLNGAKLGLGLCQVIPHVHFEHGGPWINDLGDFVPLLICIFFSSFVLLPILVGHTHFDCGALFEYGLKVALHSL